MTKPDLPKPDLTGTESYYEHRASEYDKVYDKPERQAELRAIEAWLRTVFDGRNVLEVATGTGYWTQFYVDSTLSTVATDINPAVLDVATARRAWPSTVRFDHASAFELDSVVGTFDAAFAGFFWSHMMLEQLPSFLSHLAQRLEPGSRIVLIDNNYVEGSNHPVTKTDDAGNTYQRRQLEDGTHWDVLKNFPAPTELEAALGPIASAIQIIEYDYYWIADVTTEGN